MLVKSLPKQFSAAPSWFVDVQDLTDLGYGSPDKWLQLFTILDYKLQVVWSDVLYFEILGSITRQLQHLSWEVLSNCGPVHSSSGTHLSMACGVSLQVSMDVAHRKTVAQLSVSETPP